MVGEDLVKSCADGTLGTKENGKENSGGREYRGFLLQSRGGKRGQAEGEVLKMGASHSRTAG